MLKKFDIAVNYVLKREGGLVNNQNDPGGITNMGISLRFLKSIPLETLKSYEIYSQENESINNLTTQQAKSIYKGEFWDHANFDSIFNQDNCNYIFDMSVNMGINTAIKCAQRACWAVVRSKNSIKDDGILGHDTLGIINRCEKYILPAMISERASYYRLITEKNHSNQEFLEGWLNRAYNA